MRSGHVYSKGPEVEWHDLEPRLLEALAACARVMGRFNLPLVVTSLNDSKHRQGSYHYRGAAADLRSHLVPHGDEEIVLEALKAAAQPMGGRVILEARDTPNEHYHLEILA